DVFKVTAPEQLHFKLNQFEFQTERSVINQFIAGDSLGVTLPETIRVQSTAHGHLDDLAASLAVILPQGKIGLDGRYQNTDQLAVDATVNIQDLPLGELLQIPELGHLGMQLEL